MFEARVPGAPLNPVFRPLLAWGTGRQCPCCGRWCRRFRDQRGRGWLKRESMCPYCGSRSRQRSLVLFLLEDLGVDLEEARLLHFAPEKEMEARLHGRAGHNYLSADLQPGAAMVAADMTNLGFDDQSFDIVVASHVLEHIPDDRKALSELLRVLRPGGRAILQHPIEYARETYEDASITSPDARQLAFGQSDHVRVYGRDFADRMRAGGFAVQLVRYADRVPATLVERCGLHDLEGTLKADDIYVGTRPD